jgi:hypothetical protein
MFKKRNLFLTLIQEKVLLADLGLKQMNFFEKMIVFLLKLFHIKLLSCCISKFLNDLSLRMVSGHFAWILDF